MKKPTSRVVSKPKRRLTAQDLVAVKGGGTEELYGAYSAAEVKVWQDDWLAPV